MSGGAAAVGLYPAAVDLLQVKQKISDESRQNTVTFANDAVLFNFDLIAGKLYTVQAHIIVVCLTSAVPDFKFRLNGPAANATFGSFTNIVGAAVTGGTLVVGGQAVVQLTAGVAHHLHFNMAWEPTSSGTLSLQWAQNTSDANFVIVTESSWMKVTEVP